MAHKDTYIDGSLPFSLARVAAVTGNPVLDIGYQCRDSRPYYVFTNESMPTLTLYTTLAPSKATTATAVDIYSIHSAGLNGLTEDTMMLLTTGTQTGSTLVSESFLGFEFTNTGNAHIDYRLNNINKWAKYKPQGGIDKLSAITDEEREASEYPYGLQMMVPESNGSFVSFGRLHEQIYKYVGFPADGDIARLTDFAGYNHAAELDLSAEFTVNEAEVTVTFKSNPQEGALTFEELLKTMGTYKNYSLSSFYPYILATMADENGEFSNSANVYWAHLGLNGEPAAFTSLASRTFDLSKTDGFVSGRKWKLSIIFSIAPSDSAGIWADFSNDGTDASGGFYYTLPGATGIEVEKVVKYVAVLTNAADSSDIHEFESCAEAATYATENSFTAWELTIKSGVVPESCFTGLTNLVKLTLEEGVTSIQYGAFFNCSGFTGALTIPSSVITIRDYAFSGCSGFDDNLRYKGNSNPSSYTNVFDSSSFTKCKVYNTYTDEEFCGLPVTVVEDSFVNIG